MEPKIIKEYRIITKDEENGKYNVYAFEATASGVSKGRKEDLPVEVNINTLEGVTVFKQIRNELGLPNPEEGKSEMEVQTEEKDKSKKGVKINEKNGEIVGFEAGDGTVTVNFDNPELAEWMVCFEEKAMGVLQNNIVKSNMANDKNEDTISQSR